MTIQGKAHCGIAVLCMAAGAAWAQPGNVVSPSSKSPASQSSAARVESTGPAEINPNDMQALQDADAYAYAGVIVNQTITTVAQDFFQHFAVAWRDKPLSERYTLSIHERPSARWGSQVWVEYAGRRVFQTFLPPSRARISAISADAVEIAYQNIVDAEVANLLFRDPDLGPDELKH